jgi:hypothetical protein
VCKELYHAVCQTGSDLRPNRALNSIHSLECPDPDHNDSSTYVQLGSRLHL